MIYLLQKLMHFFRYLFFLLMRITRWFVRLPKRLARWLLWKAITYVFKYPMLTEKIKIWLHNYPNLESRLRRFVRARGHVVVSDVNFLHPTFRTHYIHKKLVDAVERQRQGF